MLGTPILGRIGAVSEQKFSTVPTNGDVNPYGVAVVPTGFAPGGVLQPGDTLVSNFNNAANLQGTGTTIDRITPSGQMSVFFQSSAAQSGLDGALAVLKSGYVIVGSLPTTDGTSNTVQAGSLLVLDKNGNLVTTITDNQLLDGPWGLAVADQGSQAKLFVSNVLNGTVVRVNLSIPPGGTPTVVSETLIGSGYAHRLDPAALVVGPSGLAYAPNSDTLYVASSNDNAIYAISQAGNGPGGTGTGRLVYHDPVHLHGPLGLVLTPNGDLITANSDAQNADVNQPSELVEFTTTGRFVGQFSLDATNGGAFGLRLYQSGGQFRLAAVDDNASTLDVWSFRQGLNTLFIPRIAASTPQTFSTSLAPASDTNPYGVAVVPASFPAGGVLQAGDTLVANYNNSAGQQGLGTTIVRISPSGQSSVFFTSTTTTGLDGALAVLKSGFVIVGSLPTTDGTSNTVQPGSLLVLDKNGNLVTTISNAMIDGPWGLAVNDQGQTAQLFVSNVLNGTVIRINMSFQGGQPTVVSTTVIANGYAHRFDPAALVVGPSGLAYSVQTDTLYVASSNDNQVFAIGHAGLRTTAANKGTLIYNDPVHLHGPLDLVIAPNGNLITADSDAQNVDPNQPSELVEFTATGRFVGQFSLDANNGGAFGLSVTVSGGKIHVAAVDDNTNSLRIWTL
jgi:sugar lactone lactonase YvrE